MIIVNNINKTLLKKIDNIIIFLCKDYKNYINKIEKKLGLKILITKEFKGRVGDISNIYINNINIILIGYGKNDKCTIENLYNISGNIGKKLNNNNLIINVIDKNEYYNAQISGILLGLYKFDKYKTNKDEGNNTKIYIYCNKKYNENIKNIIKTIDIQNEIRNIINEPANILNSLTYVKYIKKNLINKVKIDVYDENRLKKEGLNLILAVNNGSSKPARMLVLKYNNNKKGKKICLIGKGVIFDTGGLDIKSGNFSDMKSDMSGSAIVYGIMKLCAINNNKVNIVGIIPIVENSVDALSLRPGDIIKCYNGKTVEITDTDAEGRLILADALSYSIKYKPDIIIDIATLTGQAGTIFGNMSTILLGNNNKYNELFKKIGLENIERVWELPIWEEYVDLTKSDIADYKNYTEGIRAGTIMGGAFLSNFVPKDKIWIHLDIAGVSYINKESETRYIGATGEILRTMYKFINYLERNLLF